MLNIFDSNNSELFDKFGLPLDISDKTSNRFPFSFDTINSEFINDEKSNISYDSNILKDIPIMNLKKENVKKKLNITDSITRDKTFKIMKKNSQKGRKKKSDNNLYYGNCHNKYSPDNIIRKIQIDYISFIRNFVNKILEELKCSIRFLKTNYNFKRTVSKEHIEALKDSTIGDILCQKISKKYTKTKNKEKNKIFYEKVKNKPIIGDILSYKYLDLFYIYMSYENIINLNNGSNINININLTKIKNYKYLLCKYNNEPKFIKKAKDSLKKYYNIKFND
jgi:hypothetical protein